MRKKFKAGCLFVVAALTIGCSTYSEDDYGQTGEKAQQTSCKNMEPAQEMKCREMEEKLVLGVGADENCNHPYEYVRNKCMKEKAKNKKLLDDSLQKHKK